MVKAKTVTESKIKKKKIVKTAKKQSRSVVKKTVKKPLKSGPVKSAKRMIEAEDIDKLIDHDQEIDDQETEDDVEDDTEDDVRLTPKIRVNKAPGQKNILANDYVVALRNKRKSYADEVESEDFESESADLNLNKALDDTDQDDDLQEDESEENDDLRADSELDGPDELPDLLPADEHINLEELDVKTKELSIKDPKQKAELDETLSVSQVDAKAKSVKIYKRIAVVFSVLVLLVLLGVLYFTMVKVSISIALNEQTVSDQASVAVYDRPQDFSLPNKAIRGLVKVVPVEQSKLYQVAGREVIGEEVVGQITIYNKYTKSQPLVASTRFLSESGKLYRLKNSVTVPAGGQVNADVYADDAKPASVVGVERFTVPGLWEGLQDKIYGQSTEGAIKYQQKLRRIIAQDDIDKALADLKQVLKDKVKSDIDNTYNDYDYKFYNLDEASLKYTVSGKIGEEKDQLPVAMSGVVELIAFSSEQAQEIARLSSAAKLPAGQDLLKIDTNSLKYELAKFDQNMVMAEVTMSYDLKSRANNNNEIVDKNKIVGLSEDQLRQYLSNAKDIKTYNIEFYPSFIRQVPSLTDRIEVKVLE